VSSAPPSAPTISTAPTIAFPGGSADVGETATITQGTYSAAVNSRSWQVLINGAVNSTITSTTFTVPVAVNTSPRAISVNELAVWNQGTISNQSQVYTANAPAATPINTASPTLTGLTVVGSTLTGSVGTWSNTPTSYTKRFKDNGVVIGGTTVTDSSPSATFDTTGITDGHSITFGVVATNGSGSSAEVVSSGITMVGTTTVPTVGAPSTQTDGGSSTLTIARPAGTVDGTLLVFVSCDDGSTASDFITSNPSFTAVSGSPFGTNWADNQRIGVCYKIAASEPATYTYTAGSTGAFRSVAAMIPIIDAAATSTINAIGNTLDDNGGVGYASPTISVSCPSVTTTTANCLQLTIQSLDNDTANSVSIATPSAHTSLVSIGGVDYANLKISSILRTAVGATGVVASNATVGSGAGATLGISIAISPSTAGGGGTTTPTEFLLFDQSMIDNVTARTTAGPFKTTGQGSWANAPGDWDRIVSFANLAVSSGLEPSTRTPIFWYIGQRMAAAAFAWLATGKTNSAYFNAARSMLLTLCTSPSYDVTLRPDDGDLGNSQSISASKMIPKVCVTYDILRGSLSASDISTIEANMLRWGNYYVGLHQTRHATILGLVAAPATYISGDPSPYAYEDSSGNLFAQIPLAAAYVNNLTGNSFCASMGLIGVVLNNSSIINEAKVYFTDWLKYGVHSTGVNYDYTRNGDNGGVATQGRIYSATNMSNAIIFAEALRRKLGDTSMYTLSTSDGHGGWNGGPKTLKLSIENELDLRTRTKNYYSAWSGNDATPLADKHLGKAVREDGTYSYHDLSYLIAYKYYQGTDPTFATKIYNVVRRNQTTYPSLEAFPGPVPPDTGAGYGYGYEFTDINQTLPAIWLIYG
jgi:hypothetical protein